MQNKNIFITVIIPTRERCETLMAAIKTCTTQNYDNFEIIVSDNDSSDGTREAVIALGDPKVRYVNPGHRVSMSKNFEFALSHCRPGYVVIIGDDDGLMPNALLDAADIISKTGVEALTGSAAYYFWPNFPIAVQRNILRIKDIRYGVNIHNSYHSLAARLSFRGEESEFVKGLPSIYYGFIKTDLIDRSKWEGNYIHSATPDAYSAIVNCLFSDKFAFSNRPLILAGISGSSNGASQLVKGVGGKEENKYLSEIDITQHHSMRYGPSISLILAESFLQVSDRFPNKVSGIKFSLARACGSALADRQIAQRDAVRNAVHETCRINHIKPIQPSLWSRLKHISRRFYEGFHMYEIRCDEANVNDIYKASLQAKAYLDSGRKPSIVESLSKIINHASRKLRLHLSIS